MDSRIREIEQWIAEAKQDLGECGREAYISKLYLLDAEIRAIIKEDGSLPAASSPRQRANNVRRRSLPTAAFATAVGVLIVAASTVYFTVMPVPSETLTAGAPAMGAGQVPPPEMISAAFIPQQIPGEEILPNDWEPPAETTKAQATQPAPSEAKVVLAAQPPAAGGAPAWERPEPVRQATSAMPPVDNPTNEATEIALTPVDRPAVPAPNARELPAKSPHTSAMGGEVEHTIATEVPTETPDEQAAFDDRGFHEPWHVDTGDKSVEELADEIENGELELNSAELADKLREVLDKSKD